MICLEKVTKIYKEGKKQLYLFDSINHQFPAGKFSVLLGKSGSGKSSLLNLISGIDTPNEGKISIGSTVITELSKRQQTLFRRRNIGFVFQSFNLLQTLTVIENIMLPMELDGDYSDATRRKAIELLEKVGLEDRCNSWPENLSGGEQQRVAIARALIHNPKIILADEPTGNLDSETGTKVLQLLLNVVREVNTTMIMATHSDEVLPHADFVYTIEKGKLQQQ